MNRNFALIAEGDVFEVIRIAANSPITERWYAGLSSNPLFIECTDYHVIPGCTYDGNNFYEASDLEKNNPLPLNIEEGNSNRVYAGIVGEDVFGTMTVLEPMDNFNMVVAGMASNPKCIECTQNPLVDVGWTWDGQNFNPPL